MSFFDPAHIFNESLKSVVGIDGDTDRANAQLAVVRGMNTAGYREAARGIAIETLDLILLVPDRREQAYLLRLLCVQQARMGMFESAAHTFAYLQDDEEQRAFAMRELGEQMAQFGLWPQALKMAEQVEDFDDYEGILRTIVACRLKAGDRDEAIQTAMLLEPSAEQIVLLATSIATSAIRAQTDMTLRRLRELLAAVRSLEEDRDIALIGIAKAFAQTGFPLEAKGAAILVTGVWERATVMEHLAMQATGTVEARLLLDDAVTAVRRIDDPAKAVAAMALIARRYEELGDGETAERLFHEADHRRRAIRNPSHLVTVTLELAEALRYSRCAAMAADLVAESLDVAEEISDALLKTRALVAIGTAWIDAGLFNEATQTVAELERILRQSRYRGRGNDVPISLSRAPTAATRTRLAVALLQENEEARKQGEMMLHETLRMAYANPDPLDRVNELLTIATTLATFTLPSSSPLP